MAADLGHTMAHAGPDAYRLAHLEAGIAAQRLSLAAASVDLSTAGLGAFYDEEIRTFLGLDHTGWLVIYGIALGVPLEQGQRQPVTDEVVDVELPWRG